MNTTSAASTFSRVRVRACGTEPPWRPRITI